MSNLVIYCLTCASPNYYTLNKPNFCSGCGKSFNTITANITPLKNQQIIKTKPLKLPKEVDLDYDEDYSDIESVPNVSQDDVFEVDGGRDQGIRIQDIAVGKKVSKIQDKAGKGKKTKFDKKSFLAGYSEQARGEAKRDTTVVPEE